MSDDPADLALTCQQMVTGVLERSHAEAVAAHRVRKL
jgi:hypothetical protein